LALFSCAKFLWVNYLTFSGFDMQILKFLQSFNTVSTYLTLASILLVVLMIYFYVINPT